MPTINIQLTKMLILQCMASTLASEDMSQSRRSVLCQLSLLACVEQGPNCSLHGLLVEAVLNCTCLRHAAC